MTYTAQGKSMTETDFLDMVKAMYNRGAFRYTNEQGKQWYFDFGDYPQDILMKACKRIGHNEPKKITWSVISNAIKEVTPKREETGKVGCAYCDTLGCIDYWREINNVNYQFSARCHKCRTSRYINLPYYSEVMPHDDIQPHSTPEQMECGKHIVEDVVKLVTGREHADAAQERTRKRTLYGEDSK